MSTDTAVSTRVRPAGPALERGLAAGSGGFSVDADLARLADEQDRLQDAVVSLLARMREPGLDPRELERLARATSHMLALAEDLRRVRARTAARRSGAARRWRALLDLG